MSEAIDPAVQPLLQPHLEAVTRYGEGGGEGGGGQAIFVILTVLVSTKFRDFNAQ